MEETKTTLEIYQKFQKAVDLIERITLTSRLRFITGTRQNILVDVVGLSYGEKQGLIFLVTSV